MTSLTLAQAIAGISEMILDSHRREEQGALNDLRTRRQIVEMEEAAYRERVAATSVMTRQQRRAQERKSAKGSR